jgi:hypothetical protein
MPEKYGRMVNRRIGRFPVGEAKDLVGHYGQPARDTAFMGRRREPREIPRQGLELAFGMLHRSGPHMKVTDRMCGVPAICWH